MTTPTIEIEPDLITAEERFCLAMIERIRKDCEDQCKPFVDRLVRLHALRPSPRLLVPVEVLQGLPPIRRLD